MTVVVFYDLETTGLNSRYNHDGVQILSIGAVTADGNQSFKNYMLPTIRISDGATRIHGLRYDQTVDDLVDRNGIGMKAEDKDVGLENFMEFLWTASDQGTSNVILVNKST